METSSIKKAQSSSKKTKTALDTPTAHSKADDDALMSKDNDGSYNRQIDRIKKMVKMYAEEYAESILEETVKNTTSTQSSGDTENKS